MDVHVQGFVWIVSACAVACACLTVLAVLLSWPHMCGFVSPLFHSSTTFKIIVAAIVALIAIFVAYVILINRKRAKRRKNRRR